MFTAAMFTAAIFTATTKQFSTIESLK